MLAARMAIWDWDMASEQITFAQNTGEVFGCTWTTIADVWNAICEEDLARLTLAGEAAEAVCGSYEEVVRIKRSGGEKPLWLQIHGKFIAGEHGAARTMRSVAIDVTGLKDAQMALHDADARKDEFLAMLAHELRNPLAPIRAGAQLLGIVHHDPAQVQRTGAIIARQVDHLTGLIDDMLDVARVTSGRVILENRPEEIGSVVGEAVEQVMSLMQERFHRLTIDNPGGALMVMGDRKRLVQVLVNLLQNAGKYTPHRGQIQIQVTPGIGEVAIRVSDNGMGMDADLVPHVFALFSQQKRALDRADGGLGLGLALVARLVALHGGRVVAESPGPACGATFTVFLPSLPADGALHVPTPALVVADKAPLRLLLVDDNIDAANILGMWLESFGHHVQVEYSSTAVLTQAARCNYDVYILDIGLPGMDGKALARRLRQFPKGAEAIMIAHTGYGSAFDKAEALAAGFDHYFVKPVDLTMLEHVLAGITQRAAPLLAA
jgi:signal transduction histidine kinase/ActR/RegA family two-component response regulator